MSRQTLCRASSSKDKASFQMPISRELHLFVVLTVWCLNSNMPMLSGVEGRRRQVKAEFLLRGSRRFYFNSCLCGVTGDFPASSRPKRSADVAEEAIKRGPATRGVNISLTVDMEIHLNRTDHSGLRQFQNDLEFTSIEEMQRGTASMFAS